MHIVLRTQVPRYLLLHFSADKIYQESTEQLFFKRVYLVGILNIQLEVGKVSPYQSEVHKNVGSLSTTEALKRHSGIL